MFCIQWKHCKWNVHFSFFVLLAFCNLFSGIQNGGMLFSAILLHESAHLLLMFLVGAKPEEVQLSALGMRIVLSGERQLGYLRRMWVSLAGPLMNLLLSGFFRLMQLDTLASIHLLMGCFHLLPIEPMDGGAALRSFLSGLCSPAQGEKISFAVSLLFLIPLSVLGFLLLLQTRNNLSLLVLSVYLMLYLLLKRRGTEDLAG